MNAGAMQAFRRGRLGERSSGLSPWELRVVEACADALFPPGGAIEISGNEAGVVPFVDQAMGRVPWLTRTLIRALLRFVELCPLALGPFPAPFTRLDHERRVRVVRALAGSRVYFFRTAFVGLRTILTLAYFANDEVNRVVGSTPNACPFERPEVAS
jgi:hypothetical protein